MQEAPQLQSKIDKAIQSLDPVSVGQSYQVTLKSLVNLE